MIIFVDKQVRGTGPSYPAPLPEDILGVTKVAGTMEQDILAPYVDRHTERYKVLYDKIFDIGSYGSMKPFQTYRKYIKVDMETVWNTVASVDITTNGIWMMAYSQYAPGVASAPLLTYYRRVRYQDA